MTAAEALQILDDELAISGQPALLTRLSAAGTGQVAFSCVILAFIRKYLPRELGGDVIQGDSLVTTSPTEVRKAGWPGAQVLPTIGDPLVPVWGDRVTSAGIQRSVQAPDPIYIGPDLVRINLQVRG